jgi:hypothetical protein
MVMHRWYAITPDVHRTHMIHFKHDSVVRVFVNRLDSAGLSLPFTLPWRPARVGRDFRAGRAKGLRVAFNPFNELPFGFEVVWRA